MAPAAPAAPASPAAWFAQVDETLASAALSAASIVAIDPIDGRFVAATATARALLAETGAASLRDLLDRGVVARPDLERFRDRTRRWLASVADVRTGEVAETWHDEVRVHLPTGAEVMRIDVVHHHRARFGRQLVFVTISRPDADDDAPRATDRTTTLWTITDLDARIVAIDPGWEVLWPDPEHLVGTLTSLLVHPEDLAEVLPVAHQLYSRALPSCSYTVRILDHQRAWVPVHVELRWLLAGEERLFVAHHRFVDQRRAMIPDGLLSAREAAVVTGLFDGLRVPQIAERDGVSVNTLRNQLSSAYRKLGATGQADLLSRFARPIQRS